MVTAIFIGLLLFAVVLVGAADHKKRQHDPLVEAERLQEQERLLQKIFRRQNQGLRGAIENGEQPQPLPQPEEPDRPEF
jgi:hypothetical protein